MTETYDPDLLVTFLAVAETGSFSEAARRRGLRQSTVSQQVRRLEARPAGVCSIATPTTSR